MSDYVSSVYSVGDNFVVRNTSNLRNHIDSYPVMASYMAPFSNAAFGFCNRHWSWRSGIDRTLSTSRRGFETVCNKFFTSALALIAEIPTYFLIIAIEKTFTIIDCIGDYYYYIVSS